MPKPRPSPTIAKLYLIPLSLAVLISGCFSAPKSASQVFPGSISQPSSAGVDSAVKRAGYDATAGDPIPSPLLEKGRRVVITAFAVELIDLQFQPGLPRQPILKPLPMYFGGLWFTAVPGVALELIGVGRRSTPMPESEQQVLTSELYDAFEADLRSRGLTVIPRDAVIASPSNINHPKQPIRKSSPFMLLNPLGSDTGQVLHSRTMTEPGLARGASRWSRRPDQTDRRILEETQADIALDIHLRVGTYRTKAALEHRSTIRITTAESMTTLKARHSIVSDADVTTETRFIPVKGRVVPIDQERFDRELVAMLPKFIALTLAPEQDH